MSSLGRLNLHRSPLPRVVLLVAVLCAYATQAAFISEIDMGGPAGRGIEVSELDPTSTYSLVIMDATPYSAANFARVINVFEIAPELQRGGVHMVTELPWPAEDALAISHATPQNTSTAQAIDLRFNRLLMLIQGTTRIAPQDNPCTDPAARANLNLDARADWLILNNQPIGDTYQTSGYNHNDIETTLDISFDKRLIDTSQGRVVARTSLPDQPIDMDQFFVGTPDTNRRFAVSANTDYIYTPGQANLFLLQAVPEPGSLTALAIGAMLILRRPRHHNAL